MSAFEDAVRPYQLPTSSPSQLSLSQYGLTTQQPILITPGLGGPIPGTLPPIITGSASASQIVKSYCPQAAVEQTT
jgi:hypothetical protein